MHSFSTASSHCCGTPMSSFTDNTNLDIYLAILPKIALLRRLDSRRYDAAIDSRIETSDLYSTVY
jgi:hypothetical protein